MSQEKADNLDEILAKVECSGACWITNDADRTRWRSQLAKLDTQTLFKLADVISCFERGEHRRDEAGKLPVAETSLVVDRHLECTHGLNVPGKFFVIRAAGPREKVRSGIGYVESTHAAALEKALGQPVAEEARS